MDFQLSEEQRIIIDTASRVGARFGHDERHPQSLGDALRFVEITADLHHFTDVGTHCED